jgi:Leucine-rich repeat (LRR) protein
MLVENELTTLPESLGSLKALKELHIGVNQIKSLPDSFSALTSLQRFGLQNNKITTLPGWLSNLPDLKWIHVESNPLDENSWKFLKDLGKRVHIFHSSEWAEGPDYTK